MPASSFMRAVSVDSDLQGVLMMAIVPGCGRFIMRDATVVGVPAKYRHGDEIDHVPQDTTIESESKAGRRARRGERRGS